MNVTKEFETLIEVEVDKVEEEEYNDVEIEFITTKKTIQKVVEVEKEVDVVIDNNTEKTKKMTVKIPEL